MYRVRSRLTTDMASLCMILAAVLCCTVRLSEAFNYGCPSDEPFYCEYTRSDTFFPVPPKCSSASLEGWRCSGPDSILSDNQLEKCKAPSGADCNWYTECLNRHYPECSGKDNYATNYGQVFCDKFIKNFELFSHLGKTWIQSVKRCLIKALAPQLSANPKPSCPELKKSAFDSHVGCYTNPPGGPSMCDLSVGDWVQVLATVKSSFLSEFSNTVRQSFSVATICPLQWSKKAVTAIKNAIFG